jgi:hypothetical protein
MSVQTRFSEQARKTAPVAADLVPGTDSVSGEDIHLQMADIATVMRVLLADQLLTTDDRTKINTPPPAIGIQRRYYRGATPPAVDSNNANPGAGWASTLATGTDAVWEIYASFNNGVFVPPWSAPVKISGERGIEGLPGTNGQPGNVYFFQGGAPTTVGRLLNDVWWDSANNFAQYRWNGTAWVPSFQPMLTLDEAGRVTGLVRAGESGKNFVLLADKFQIWNGTDAQVPFEVIDGVVYIREAVIRQVAAARIIGGTIVGQEIILSGAGSKIRSEDFSSGVSGWQISGTGAEFPALVVRSGNIENNAVTRRYGGKVTLGPVNSANTWVELIGLDVTMGTGEDAHINIALTFLAPSTPYPTDGLVRLLRADNTEVNGCSWTVQGGKAEAIGYSFYDNVPTTRYKLQGQGLGGVFQARDTAMNITVYRK